MPVILINASKSGIYHIIMRGINRQSIFEDEEDCSRFIETLQKYKEICEYKLYAYCLMGNHLHLLLMEGKEQVCGGSMAAMSFGITVSMPGGVFVSGSIQE